MADCLNFLFKSKPIQKKSLDGLYESLRNDSFSAYMFGLNIHSFQNRLLSVFKEERESLLDVGCGIGVWSIAASYNYNFVLGIDTHQKRIEFAKRYANLLERENVQFESSTIFKIANEQQFNNVICINTLTFILDNQVATLKEIQKHCGGKLYLTVHGVGYGFWLLFKAILNFDYKLFKQVISMLHNNLKAGLKKKGTMHFFFTDSYTKRILKQSNWKIISSGLEGSVDMPKKNNIFKKRFLFMPIMYEYILEPSHE